jgi:putative acetyltransferase
MNQIEMSIDILSTNDEREVTNLIRRNLQDYHEAGNVLSSTFRRLESLLATYSAEASVFFVGKDKETGRCLAGAGLGPLHGLPPSEGVGEIRDLVVDENFRGKGFGGRLLNRCINEAQTLGYRTLYLETTSQMENAQKLFLRRGFRPVVEKTLEAKGNEERIPCYFVLESL